MELQALARTALSPVGFANFANERANAESGNKNVGAPQPSTPTATGADTAAIKATASFTSR